MNFISPFPSLSREEFNEKHDFVERRKERVDIEVDGCDGGENRFPRGSENGLNLGFEVPSIPGIYMKFSEINED